MRLWWWRKVRRANIPKEDRDLFERFGASVIGFTVANAWGPRDPELQAVFNDAHRLKAAREWLTEQGDTHERREQRLETIEWGIIFLIVLELLVAGYGIWLGSKEATQQAAVSVQQTALLDQLQKNASATANTLTSLAGTMEDMQKTEQSLLALNYDVSVTVSFTPNPPSITLMNNSKTNVTFWGYRVADEKPFFRKMPGIANPSILYLEPGDAVFESISKRVPKEQKANVPVEVYLRNEKGDDYVAKVEYGGQWSSGVLSIYSSRMLSIKAERWSDKTGK